MSTPLTPAERAYYIDGFLAALRRFRRAAITGWIAAAAGVLSFLLSWSGGTPHGVLDVVASCAAAAAGIALVEQSVGMLQAYVTVPFHEALPQETPLSPLIGELRSVMEDVEQGGWQEAFAAIARVERLRGEGPASQAG